MPHWLSFASWLTQRCSLESSMKFQQLRTLRSIRCFCQLFSALILMRFYFYLSLDCASTATVGTEALKIMTLSRTTSMLIETMWFSQEVKMFNIKLSTVKIIPTLHQLQPTTPNQQTPSSAFSISNLLRLNPRIINHKVHSTKIKAIHIRFKAMPRRKHFGKKALQLIHPIFLLSKRLGAKTAHFVFLGSSLALWPIALMTTVFILCVWGTIERNEAKILEETVWINVLAVEIDILLLSECFAWHAKKVKWRLIWTISLKEKL